MMTEALMIANTFNRVKDVNLLEIGAFSITDVDDYNLLLGVQSSLHPLPLGLVVSSPPPPPHTIELPLTILHLIL